MDSGFHDRIVYRRDLPGGGFVAIEVKPSRSIPGARTYRGEVVVERRAEPERRRGHPAPVIAEMTGATMQSIVRELFSMTQSNVAIATRCLELLRRAAPDQHSSSPPFRPLRSARGS